MKVGLKTKLTLAISCLVLGVVLLSSTLYVWRLTEELLISVANRGESAAELIYEQAHDVLAGRRMPPGMDPRDPAQLRKFVQSQWNSNTGLTSLLESFIGSSPDFYYVAITDAQRKVIVHNDPGEIGLTLTPVPPCSELLRASFFSQLRAIYGERHIYDIDLAMEMSSNPVGDVHVGVSTLFMREQVTKALQEAVAFSLLLIGFATLTAGMLSYGLLRPLEAISRGVDRWARGEYSESIQVDRRDEWGALSSKLNLLGEQMRGEKAVYVNLKDNLDQLLASLTDGLMLFDAQDRLLLATPAVSRFLGHPTHELHHRPAAQVFSGTAPLDRLLTATFDRHQALRESTVVMPNGDEASRVTVSVEFIESEGQTMGSLVTLRDSSSRALLENQIDLTARIAALGKIMSGVAHEVKNPLNAMVLQFEILKAKLGEEQERVSPQIRILGDELRRLDRVVKTFLDFTRPVELRRNQTDLEKLVREVFTLAEPQARQNGVRLVFEPNGRLPGLTLDPDLIKQALLNLVLNGCQAMPQGGQLTIAPHTFADHVELEIKDEGIGIPAEAQSKIFSLFFSTKPGGTGVGLAMAFRIVQLHNGFMDFASEPGHGTTFRVSLPR